MFLAAATGMMEMLFTKTGKPVGETSEGGSEC